MKMTKQRKAYLRRKRSIWLAVEIICAIVCLVILYFMGEKIFRQHEVSSEENAAKEIAEMREEDTALVAEYQAETPFVQPIEMLDYFRPLAEENEDIAGLVEFGKDMALYVAQADDNYYYLNHKFDRTESSAGMIYMDYECKIEPVSANTILYGHNMGDGSRFGTLKRFERAEYIREYPVIRFTSLYRPGNYAVIAVYHTTVDQTSEKYIDFRKIEFETETEFYAYLNTARNASIFEIPVDANPDDELLTMVTCSNEMDQGRLVLVCRKQRTGETMEDLNDWMTRIKSKKPIYP